MLPQVTPDGFTKTHHGHVAKFKAKCGIPTCAMSCRTAPELAVGKLRAFFDQLCNAANNLLVPALAHLPRDQQLQVLSDFASARIHISLHPN